MSDSIANGFFKCGSSTQNINILNGATQWVGQIGYPIYYEPKVGIGSNATPTATLQVTGNVYASNAVTAGFFYGDGSYLTNVGAGVSSQWTGTTGNPIFYVPYVGIGSTDPPTANLSVTGNVYVSNAVTTTNVYAATAVTAGFFYGDGSGLTNVGGGGGQWTGETGEPIFYVPYVGIGSADLPTANLQVTGNVYVSETLTAGGLESPGFCDFGSVYCPGTVSGGQASFNTISCIQNLDVTGTTDTIHLTANTVTVTATTGDTSPVLVVNGNARVSDMLTSSNVNVSNTLEVTGAMISNVDSTVFLFDTFSIPYIVTDGLVANVVSSNDTVSANLTVTNRLTVANLFVTGNVYITSTNTVTSNAITIDNTGTTTALIVRQGEPSLHTHNVAEFYDATTPALIIDAEGNLAVHTTVSPNYAMTLVDGASFDVLTLRGNPPRTSLDVTGNVYVSNAVTTTNVYAATEVLTGTPDVTTLDVTGNVYVSNALTVPYAYISNIYTSNIVGFLGSQWTTGSGNVYYTDNVGVGTSSVGAKLTVDGNVYASNSVTTTNVYAATEVLTGTTGQTTLAVSGNVYVSNALTVPYAYISNIFTSNIVGFLGSQWTTGSGNVYYTESVGVGTSSVGAKLTVDGNVYASNSVTTTNVYAATEVLTGTTGQTTLAVSGNVYVSNALTVPYAYISNIYTSNIVGFVGSQWTGTTGEPITYMPHVGIGSVATPTANLSVTGNVYASNAVTTVDVFATTVHTSNARVTGTLVSEYITVSNLSVTGNFYITATNTSTTNSFTIDNTGTTTALIVRQTEPTVHTHNVAEFYDATTPALIIDPEGNLAVHTTVSPNYALTLVDGASFDVLTIRGNPPLTSLLVTGNVDVSDAITTERVFVTGAADQTSLDVTGNVFVSNALTTTNLFAATGTLTGTPGVTTASVTGNIYVSNAVTTTNVYAVKATLTGLAGVTTLDIDGNVYVSNAVTAGFFYGDGSGLTNVGGGGSQWTGTAGEPITYVPYVGIGSDALPTANLQVTGNLYVTSTIQYGEDLVRRAPHLVPSASNAGVITAWMSGTCNAVAVQGSFWALDALPPLVSNIAIGPPGLDSYTGSVLLNNGRVLFVPSAVSSGIGLFNPATDQYSVVTPAGSVLAGGYSGGVLVPNGNVVFVSNTATSIGVYNPATLTFSSAPAHKCATPAFFGGTLGPNSNVIMVPSTGHSNIGEYSPVTGIYSNAAETGMLGGYAGAVLIPNGNVVCVPWNSGQIGQYDYMTRTFSNSLSVEGQFAGGVLAPNGTVVCVPSTLSNVVVFDPVTNTGSNIIAAAGFFGGVLMPTGNIVCVPSTNSNVGWIDPIRLTYSNIVPQSVFGGNAFRGGTLLPDGRVIFCPYDATNVAGIQSLTPAPVEFCRSPYFNKF